MSRHGVGDGTRVVLYDGFMNMWAARLWWMLRAYGFDEAAVLNGGWHKWKTEGRQASSDVPKPPKATFKVVRRRDCFVGSQEVLRGIGDSGTCLVDALTPEHYAGQTSFYGRAGHIKSAVNVPFLSVVDPETQAYLAPTPCARGWRASVRRRPHASSPIVGPASRQVASPSLSRSWATTTWPSMTAHSASGPPIRACPWRPHRARRRDNHARAAAQRETSGR